MIDLDDDVSKYLPELKDAVILKGFDDKNGGKPILEKAQNPITLRLVS
jgi:CubicO group peptidase (beta-lactamase class C family)